MHETYYLHIYQRYYLATLTSHGKTARIKGTSWGKGHSYRYIRDMHDKLCKLYRNYDM